MKTRNSLNGLIVLVLLGSIAACSTKKNTVVTRSYHNLTAHYNVYFNGNESFKKGVVKINEAFKDNYNKVLPIFKYGDKTVNTTANGEMDYAIKKSLKTIKLHSLKVKPRYKGTKTPKQKEFESKPEFCNWIDDAYLLMGKSHFYKQEFSPALNAFGFITKTFEKEPIRFDAMLWTVRTHNESGRYEEAKEALLKIKSTKEFPQKYDGEIALITADFYLKQKKYQEAIPELEKAITYEKKKKNKARYKYVLAQVYHETKDDNKASQLYEEVINLHPDYEMNFNAEIHRAMSYDANQSSDELVKQLKKMLKDEKNLEYQDQIYYALATIYQKKGDLPQAIAYYKLSARKSVSNKNQKGLSYLALGDIYYKKPKYDSAAVFFDSTMMYLKKDVENYDSIAIKAKSLSSLVKNLKQIALEDSLQRMSRMSETDRNALIDNTIAAIKTAEIRKKIEEQNALANQSNTPQNNAAGGMWYFYNSPSISQGKTDFERIWGRRKLEDDWRRSNKVVDITNNENNTEVNKKDTAAVKKKTNLTNLDREFYLKDLPQTPQDYEKSNNRIVESLLNIATIYEEELNDKKEAIKVYEDLLNRFPENKYLLTCYYKLYELNTAIGETATADFYKKRIIAKFPDSRYAKIFTNPNYFNELKATQNEVENMYELALTNYQSRNYPLAMNVAQNANTRYPDNLLTPKFSFIAIMSEGGISKDIQKTIANLRELIKKYPNDEMAKHATETIKFLDIKQEELKKEEVLFASNPNEQNYFMFLLKSTTINQNQFRFDLTSFNLDNFKDDNLKIENDVLNSQTLFVVKGFANQAKVMLYVNQILLKFTGLEKYPATDWTHFAISLSNLDKLKNQGGKLDNYLLFYNKEYLKR